MGNDSKNSAETAQIKVEDALRESENNLDLQSRIFNTTLAFIVDFVYVIDQNARFVYANQPLLDLLAVTDEEIRGKNFFDLNYPLELATRLQNQIELVFRTGETVKDETEFTGASGANGFYEYIFNPVFAADGTVKMVAGSTRDVTDRKRTETNLGFLAEITQDLARLTGADEIMKVVGAKIGAFLDLSQCNFVEIDEAADQAVVRSAWHRADAPNAVGVYRLAEYVSDEFYRQARAGEIFVSRNSQTDSRIDGARHAALEIGSFLSLPLVRDGLWKFQIVVARSAPHDWSSREIELMRELTARIWTRLERVRAEQELRESEEKFRTLADNISQLAWMTDADGWIFWYNERWFEYTGTTLEEMQGWGWQAVHHPAEVGRVTEKFKQAVQTGEVWEDTFPLRSKTGEFRWFLSRAVPIRDEQGKVVRWFGTNTDVDDQRRLDQRNRFIIEIDEAVRPLETSQEITLTLARLLGEYLDADRCAYAEVEADEDRFYIQGDYTKGGTQSIVGQYRMADFGAEVLRLMRENLPYVVHDVNTDPQVSESDSAAYRLTEIQSVICVPLHKNNRFSACMAVHQKTPRRWLAAEVELVTFVANRFWESIERARIIKSLHDSLAREQEARLQAEAANRLKDEFLATVSHELRTPLNAIIGWSSMLQTGKADEEMRRRADETIYRSAKSQAQLIEDLLDVSRIISGNLRIRSFPVNLVEVVESSVEILRPAAEAKSIRLEIMPAVEPCRIVGDAQRLQQIVWNLVSNAVKFTVAGGTVKIGLETDETRVRLIVSDDGKGIEPEFLPYIFERFRQQDGSTTRRHGGLGLGLAIVRNLTELHGGTIFAESAGANRGAKFTVELPRQSDRADAENLPGETEFSNGEAAAQKSKRLLGVRVLLVDDEPDTLELFDAVLKSEDADVRIAESARAAFEIFRQWQPHVLVSDIAMPIEDGYALITKVRQLPADERRHYARDCAHGLRTGSRQNARAGGGLSSISRQTRRACRIADGNRRSDRRTKRLKIFRPDNSP